MRQVGDKESLDCLLLEERIRLNITVLPQVVIKAGLPRQLPTVHLFCPERVLAEVLPGDALHRVLL